MSLNYDLSALPEAVAFQGEEIHPITDAIIWYTLFTGIGELTDKTLPEFIARVRVIDKVDGPLLNAAPKDGGEELPYVLTDDDIIARKGLRTGVTNVGLRGQMGMSRAKFLKQKLGGRMDDTARAIKARLAADARREGKVRDQATKLVDAALPQELRA